MAGLAPVFRHLGVEWQDCAHTAENNIDVNIAVVALAIVAGLLLLLAVVLLLAGALSARSVRAEARALLAAVGEGSSDVLREEEIASLPEPVQRWLRRANVVGREPIRTVRLKQRGSLRLGPGQRWMPFVAEQYYTTSPPAFLWHASFRLLGLPILDVTDSLRDGRGRIRPKVGALVPISSPTGREIDQGTLVRFLN